MEPTGQMKYNTEVSHPVHGMSSAPVREAQPTFTASVSVANRSNSLEPQKEHVVPIQKPPSYQRNSSINSYRNTGSTLSRQSTNDSNDSDTTISQTLNTSASGSSTQQPIKKSPREFIIPIAVEGGGIVTPRTNNVEQSESSATTNSASSFASKRLGRPRKLGFVLRIYKFKVNCSKKVDSYFIDHSLLMMMIQSVASLVLNAIHRLVENQILRSHASIQCID